MRKTVIERYEDGLFKLTIESGYKYFFEVLEDKGFERNKEQVLAIMECQYEILGNLIRRVKEEKE